MRVGVGHVPTLVRPEAQHAAVGRGARQLPPARPLVLERVHRPLDGPGAGTRGDGVRQVVHRQLGIFQRITNRRDHLVGLIAGETDRLGMPRHGHRQGRQRAGPHREVRGRHQMDRAAWAERLDQRPVFPERPLDVASSRSRDAPADGQLGGPEHLGVDAAQERRDAGRVEIRGWNGKRLTCKPPCHHLAPGHPTKAGRRHHGARPASAANRCPRGRQSDC